MQRADITPLNTKLLVNIDFVDHHKSIVLMQVVEDATPPGGWSLTAET
jgi:hypothetical protein